GAERPDGAGGAGRRQRRAGPAGAAVRPSAQRPDAAADQRPQRAPQRTGRAGSSFPTMKLGLSTGYWSAGPPAGVEESIAEAERLGFDSIWTAEAYGSDCLTPRAWWGAKTERLKLGTAIAQISARTPAATAMAAITLDHLSGGRFVLGLGA